MALPRFYRRAVPQRIREIIRSLGGFNLIEEVHVECLDQSIDILLKWCQKNPQARLMLTPQFLDLSIELVNKTDNPIGLHLHRDLWTFGHADYFMQDQLCEPTHHIASGHWNYDWNFLKDCSKRGYVFIHLKCKIIHEFYYGLPPGLTLIPVHRHLHDYDILRIPPTLS